MNNPVQPPATVALVGTLDTKGADHRWVVPHLGPTTSGTIGAQTAVTLDEAAARVQEMRDAAVAVNPPRDRALPRRPDRRADAAAYVLARTGPVAPPRPGPITGRHRRVPASVPAGSHRTWSTC